jgi:glucose-6-phosphate 1-epimerase
MVYLSNAIGDSATISPYGAQVLSWRTAAGGEHLYCSPTVAIAGRPVRGGTPVCFPQFANCGPLAKHGFARTSVWQMHAAPITGACAEVASACFRLQDSSLTLALWPFGFTLELQVSLGNRSIEWRLKVTNTGSATFDFTTALHTYLAVSDVQQVAVLGLASVHYLDALNKHAKAVSHTQLLNVPGEMDRVYVGAPPDLHLVDKTQRHIKVHIEQAGFADTVVWNPGPLKATTLQDMPSGDWTRMLCVEAAQIEHPIRLATEESWQAMQRLTIIGAAQIMQDS